MMTKRWLTLALGLGASLVALAGPAHATPTCTTTTVLPSGSTVPAAFLLTPGNCVEASDKLFGNFAVSGDITAGGSASFSFFATPGNVTVGFDGVVTPNSIASLQYEVAIDPALSQGFLINDLQVDFTLNAVDSIQPASAVLTAITTPPTVALTCTRSAVPPGGTCPDTSTFAPVSDLVLTQTLATGSNAIVTALTNTISQVPEPSSLLLLGAGLVGLGVMGRRHRA